MCFAAWRECVGAHVECVCHRRPSHGGWWPQPPYNNRVPLPTSFNVSPHRKPRSPEPSRTTVKQPEDKMKPTPEGRCWYWAGRGKMRPPRTCCDIAATMFISPKRIFGGRKVLRSHDGLLVSCRRDDQPGSVVTILYGVTPPALTLWLGSCFTDGRLCGVSRRVRGSTGRLGG